METLFYDGWEPLVRTIIIGFFGYIGLIVLLRISGKRTLSKMNMFDFIVTVAFGSILAGMIMAKDTTLAQGLTAFVLLIVLQFIFTFLSVRWPLFDSVIKAEPRLLYHEQKFLAEAMKDERVAKSELHAAVRANALGDISQVHSIILETNGELSVIPLSEIGSGISLPESDNGPADR